MVRMPTLRSIIRAARSIQGASYQRTPRSEIQSSRANKDTDRAILAKHVRRCNVLALDGVPDLFKLLVLGYDKHDNDWNLQPFHMCNKAMIRLLYSSRIRR